MERITFSHAIVPTRISIPYRLGLVVVALAMLLLPAIYLALIVGTLWFSYWYLTTVGPSLVGSGSLWVRGLALLGPPFAAGVLAFFLIKPVLARRATGRSPVPVEPHEEPELFAFIEQICRQVGAPVPQRVQVDCQVNASASFVPGPLSMVKGDLILTVGLPLVAGLSARELGGVLAHEFGHFAQGGALRLTWIVRSINAWFYRVVYERDQWDVRLEEWTKNVDARFAIVVALARLCVWLSRHALAGLMFAGHAVSCFLMRQMEYDADSYEIKLAGSVSFTRTMMRLRELSAGVQYGYHELRQARTLPANLPQFFVERTRLLPDTVQEEVQRTSDAPTRPLDTHPSDLDRIHAAERAADAGVIVGGDEPATGLFRNFDAIAAEVTWHHYEHDLGLTVDAKTLVGTADAINESNAREERSRAVKRYFDECVSIYRPLRIADVDSSPVDEVRAKLAAAREAMGTSDPALRDSYRQWERLTVRADKAFVAEELCVAGASVVDCEEYELEKGTLDDAQATQRWAANELTTLTPALERFEQAASLRLACALSLVRQEPEAADVRTLIDAFHVLGSAVPRVFAVTRFLNAHFVLSAASNSIDPPPAASSRLATMEAKISKTCVEIFQALGSVQCPRLLSDEPSTMAAWCGIASDVATFHPTEVLPQIMSSYWALLGHVVTIAQNSEDRIRNGPVLG